jgi:hypothetical protein
MNSIWLSLVWKEWREHRWKLAWLTAIYIVTIFIAGSAMDDAHFGLFGAASVTFIVMVPLTSMIVAMGIAAGEQGRGTIGFLQALPTRMARPAAAKIAMATVTVIAPGIIAVAVTYLLARLMYREVAEQGAAYDLQMYGTSWGLESWYAARALAVGLGGVSILLWVAAASVNRSDEVRAGAVSLLVIMVVWSGVVLAGFGLSQDGQPPAWWSIVISAGPGGVAANGDRLNSVNLAEFRRYAGGAAASAMVVHLALAAWYIRRFGRVSRAKAVPAEGRQVAFAEKSWLAPPRRGPIAAIVWKQTRESGPLAILGAAMTVAATLVIAGYHLWNNGDDVDGVMIITTVTGWAWVGLFVSLVAGIGLFMDDLQPRLHAFWRSRPIGVGQWFGVKFIVGAVTTLATLAVPPILVLTIAALAGLRLDNHERMVGELFDFAPTMISVQLELFCLGVAAIILVRQAAYAAILALAAAGLVMATGARLELFGDSRLLTTMWIASAAAIVIAWIAVRNDWGWKH